MSKAKKVSLAVRVSLPPKEAAIYALLSPDTRSQCVLLGLRALGLLEGEEPEEKTPAGQGGER